MSEQHWTARERYADNLWHFLEFDASTDVPRSERRIIQYTENGRLMERFETHEEIVRAAWLKGMEEWDAVHDVS